MAAPGPYICAETQAGGLPIWLASKRHVRLRHSVNSFYRKYDQEYSRYCEEWFRALIPHMVKHQITYKKGGCLIAFQIENESFEVFKGIPLGVADDMRHLCKVARDCGITVPFFTNDAWEEGSFVTRPPSHRVFGKETFGIDLFGFDKYIVFCPTSAPLATLSGTNESKTSWGEWNVKDVINGIDGMEKRVRAIGGGAAETPIFIPELQGGWFNHYTVKHTYDDVYSYYGESYTKLVLDSVLSQGVTAFSYYMFFGGTNWGTIGDPDVYTSYDYSACIREMGHLSGRARKLRLGLSFTRSFSSLLARTDMLIEKESPFISARRRSVLDSKTEFVFFRNFDSTKTLFCDSKDLPVVIPYKESFIGLVNYTVSPTLEALRVNVPVYTRTRLEIKGRLSEIWIIQYDFCGNNVAGSLLFKGKVAVDPGTIKPMVEERSGAQTALFLDTKDVKSGWFSVKSGEQSQPDLYVLCLPKEDLYTLEPYFEEPYWLPETDRSPDYPLSIMWGAYGAHYDPLTKNVKIEHSLLDLDKTLFTIDVSGNSLPGFTKATGSFAGLSFIFKKELPSSKLRELSKTFVVPRFGAWSNRAPAIKDLPWVPLPMLSVSKPAKNTIDYAYTSGHALYRLRFVVADPTRNLTLNINLRHRGTIYLNDNFVSNHIVYHLGILRAGSKNGPDNTFGGWKAITLPSHSLMKGENTIIVLIESFGLNRQPFSFNDIRCPRGIIEARIQGISDVKWDIAGVDVRHLKEAYNICGIPGENTMTGYKPFKQASPLDPGARLELDGIPGPCWFTSTFDFTSMSKELRAPLRLVMTGPATCYVTINGIMIARYYGNGDGPQSDFYVPDGILKPTDNSIRVLGYRTSLGDEWLGLEFKLWNFDTLDRWSGNLGDGSPLMILSDTLVKS